MTITHPAAGLRAMVCGAMLLLAASVAQAHSGGGGGGGASGGGRPPAIPEPAGSPPPAASTDAKPVMQPKDCKPGTIWVRGECARAELLPDDELYRGGRALALAGHYHQALRVLEAIRRTNDPMVFTMRGYATRKLGRFADAMALYDRALALDPGNINTHEYIGEGYVTTGHLELARAELAKVEIGCGGRACEQYEDLARSIETGRVE